MSYAKLRGRIREMFHTQEAFAASIGMNTATLSGKLNGRSDWTRKEIERACSVLDISINEMPLYFFCIKSCETATN